MWERVKFRGGKVSALYAVVPSGATISSFHLLPAADAAVRS